MVFGFPLMFLANFAPKSDLNALLTCIIVGVAFVALNVVLFRSKIFKRRQKVAQAADGGQSANVTDLDDGAQIAEGADKSERAVSSEPAGDTQENDSV